jgi:hypothetical protein
MESTNRSCRNCGGGEFYSKVVSLTGEVASLIPLGFFGWSRGVRLRVWGNCGLMEWFVRPDTLEKVKRKFQKDS